MIRESYAFLALAGALLAVSAAAQDKGKQPFRPAGPMTLAQMQQWNPAISNEMFTKMDADHNGLVSPEELRAGMQAGVTGRPAGANGPAAPAKNGRPAATSGTRPEGVSGPPGGFGNRPAGGGEFPGGGRPGVGGPQGGGGPPGGGGRPGG